jgi:hypothetical protein
VKDDDALEGDLEDVNAVRVKRRCDRCRRIFDRLVQAGCEAGARVCSTCRRVLPQEVVVHRVML